MSGPHQGQRLIVTGGASGIGLAVVRLAVQRGASVCMLDRDTSALSAAQRELQGLAHPITCDVANPDSVATAMQQAIDRIGGLDAVVNSAGIDALSPLGITHVDMPATPEKIWRAIKSAERGASS